MRRISINARLAQDAASTDEIDVALFHIEHPLLDAPIRLSTDNADRISMDPPIYGTRSSWLGADPFSEPYLFIVASAELPGDQEDAPASAAIILETVDSDLVGLLLSFTDQPTIHMAVVKASTPDTTEVEYQGMKIIGVDGNSGEISLQISRAPIEEEAAPMDSFTKDRFPGLFR